MLTSSLLKAPSILAITPPVISLLWTSKTVMFFRCLNLIFLVPLQSLFAIHLSENAGIFGSEAKWNRFRKVHFKDFGLPLHTVIFLKRLELLEINRSFCHFISSRRLSHLKWKKFFPGERVGKAVPIDNWEFRKFKSKFLHKRLALFVFIIPAPSICPTPSSVLVFLPHWLKTDNTQHRVFEFLRERKRRTRTTVFMLITENKQRAYTELINAF